MKQVLKAFLGFTAALLLAGCNNLIQIDEVGTTTTTSSSSSGGVTYAMNSDGTVTLNFSSLYGSSSSSVSRSISPSTPELYWTVYGSTVATSGDADYSATTGDLSTVWYGAKDTTSGVSFTIGAVNNRVWYFTAIATREEQSTICTDSDTTDAAKVEKIKGKAIAKGTIAFKMTIDQSEGTVTLTVEGTSSTAGSEINATTGAITIGAVDSPDSDAKGKAYIPISIPANWDDIEAYDKIDTVTLTLNASTKYTVTGITTGTEAVTFAFVPELDPGTYDVELTFLHTDDNDSNTGDGTLDNQEVFSIHDTLTIKANYDSYVVGSTNTSLTGSAVSYQKTAASSVAYSGLTNLDEAASSVGYTLTEALIKAYTRTTFYVDGTGSNTASASETATGSKTLPFANVADAVAAIPQIANAASTTWTIIVDGDNTDTTAVSITMASTAKKGTILVKAYDSTARATIASGLTIQTTKDKSDFAFILENITATGAVTVGTPYFYLNNSVLSGAVTLLKTEGDSSATYDGILNAAPTGTSKAQNITLEGTSGKFVVKRCKFNADTGLPEDDASATFPAATYNETEETSTGDSTAPFALNSTYQANDSGSYKRYLRVITDKDTTLTRKGVDGTTDIAVAGDLAVAYNVSNGSISYGNTTLTFETEVENVTSPANGKKFTFTVKDASGNAYNPTGWTVTQYAYLGNEDVTSEVLQTLSGTGDPSLSFTNGVATVTLYYSTDSSGWENNAMYNIGVKVKDGSEETSVVIINSSSYYTYTN